jgi:hypothetical protein
VLLRVRLAAFEVGVVDPQEEPAAAGGEVADDALADPDLDAELLAALAAQRLCLGLTGFELAAGELPQAGQLGRVGAGGGQDRAAGADRGGDDDAGFGGALFAACFAHRPESRARRSERGEAVRGAAGPGHAAGVSGVWERAPGFEASAGYLKGS